MADQSYRIGRIFGISIELHWTFIVLMLLFFVYNPFLFFGALFLFLCVLIHELAHSVTCLRNNVKVRKIILLPLGGASMIDERHLDPRLEFNIAVAGPIMSLLLGSIFGLLAVISSSFIGVGGSQSLSAGLVTQFFQIFFLLNILLGLFNLLPAFPTDGGRVFRSYLERKYDEYKATNLTIRAGNYVMVLFMIGTLAYVLLINATFINKLYIFFWNLVIVIFLFSSGQSEKQFMEIKREAIGITVRDVVSNHFKLVSADTTIPELYATMRKTKEHIFLIRLGKEYAYLNLLGKRTGSIQSARDISVRVPTVEIGSHIIDALQLMETNDAPIAAVLSNKKLVGVITISHIQSFLSLHGYRRGK